MGPAAAQLEPEEILHSYAVTDQGAGMVSLTDLSVRR